MSSDSKPSPSKSQNPLTTEVHAGVEGLEAMIQTYGMARQPPTPSSSDSVVGQVVDTHHPHRPGRICVRWRDASMATQEHWLAYSASMRPEVGRHVILSRPSNWSEWVVTSMLSQARTEGASKPALDPDTQELGTRLVRLEESEAVRIETAQGELMFELCRAGAQPVLRLGHNLTIALAGTLRFEAERIEMRSGGQGTDLRSEGPTVLRAPQVRIN